MSGSDTPPSHRHDDVAARTEDHVTPEESTDTWNLPGCERLERRWLLWHGFMKEHAHLDAWLRLAEHAVASHNWSRVTYAGAKDAVRRFERLRCEAASHLVHLDTLAQRNRTLTLLFRGAMRSRLLDAARDCGHRWDRLNVKLESISGRLKGLVCEWEEFEEEMEELAVWLAEMEVQLVEVQHVTGNECDKLGQLQSFQRSVCVKCARVNGVLERGEALIQRGAACDAQRAERRLLELLRRCGRVYDSIGRAHTRLLSMRLVRTRRTHFCIPAVRPRLCLRRRERLTKSTGTSPSVLKTAVIVRLRRPRLSTTTWVWSGTPRWTWDAPSPAATSPTTEPAQTENEEEEGEKEDEEDEESCCDGAEQRSSEARRAARRLLLAAVTSLLACLLWSCLEPSWRRGAPGNLHLSYVNGPPPT
ncbi:nesprin-2 isoform X4 [Phyllopteryx taeniolatus]|uniref:nesprin-2 isoform X4 n=1 Tax=Phyllopteryx taeniolatus TaxID=161469 RepID=UPI002AD35FB7|nr:nesprin-2 isoform X4 [Phyllopteryx taeniolatus]